MYRDDASIEAQLKQIKSDIRVLQTQAPVGFTAVSRGALRILSPEGLIVVGSARTTGTQYVSGRLEGDGVFDWSGAVWLRGSVMIPGNLTGVGSLLWSGPWEMRGNGDITGAVGISGNVTLDSDLSLGSGRIIAGSIVIDKNGGYGGRLTAATLLFDTGTARFTGTIFADNGVTAVGGVNAPTGDIVATTGNINAPNGDVGGFSKSFWIDHPTKPGKQLRHGSLEGPEHGVYYRGVIEFDAEGEAVFELPDYFTSLVMPDDEPTVQVTPIGRPFPHGAERVVDGNVTIYGDAGREAHVTITAARGHFDIEPDKVELSIPVPPE